MTIYIKFFSTGTDENNNAQRNMNNIICIMYLNKSIKTYILL
jgi:hypothetical protein